MIVLDASVLIAYLESRDDHHAAAEKLLTHAVGDDLAAHPVTVAEVLVAPARGGHLDVALAALRGLEVNELAFPADAAVRLARLRAETGLRMPDCCVLLAAEAAGAEIASFDARLRETAVARNLPVREP